MDNSTPKILFRNGDLALEVGKPCPRDLEPMATAGLQRALLVDPPAFSVHGVIPVESASLKNAIANVKEVRRAARGCFRTHPIEVTLGYLAAASDSPVLDRAVGHFLLARFELGATSSGALRPAVYSGSLALRKLMGSQHREWVADALVGSGPLDLDGHRLLLGKWKAGACVHADELRRAIEDLERCHAFMAAVRKPHPGRTRNNDQDRGDREVSSPSTASGPTALSDPSEAKPLADRAPPQGDRSRAPAEAVDRMHYQSVRAVVSARKRVQSKQHGETIEECASAVELPDVAASAINHPGTSAPPQQRLPSGHFEVRARRAAAQGLLLAEPGAIRPTDIEILLDALAATPSPSLVCKAAVAAALYGGQEPDRMLDWVVAETINDAITRTGDRCSVVLDPFGLVVPLRATRMLPRMKSASESYATETFLPWDLDFRGMKALRAHVCRRAGSRLFQVGELAEVQTMLDSIRGEITTALSLPRLAKVLPNIVSQMTGDVVMAALLTGSSLDGPTSTRLNYFRTSNDALAAVYHKAANRLHMQIRGHSLDLRSASTPLRGDVGSQRCPSTSEIAVFVNELTERVGTPPRGRPTRQAIYKFHNNYSVYVIECLSAGSGIRPHSGGLACLQPVGASLWADEKYKGVPSLRQIPLTPDAMRLWARFDIHRKWVIEKLGLNAKSLPVFFWISDRGFPRPFTFTRVREISGWPFVGNAHRHVYKSYLRSIGVRGTDVDVLMGHWGLGEEPGNRYSSREPESAQSRALPAVQDLMRLCGWKVLEGFGRG